MSDIVKVEQALTEVSKKKQFCTFWIAGRMFGVDINYAREVNTNIDFTPIFHAPKEVKGYVNIRGQIYLVIDLPLLLGFETSNEQDTNRVVIFKNEVGESFGVLVDKIGDVIEVEEKEIEEVQKSSDKMLNDKKVIVDDLAEGVCRLDDTLLLLLKPGLFLSTVEKLLV